mmetsp:Transcript_13705/g.38613  ORF Transcript_13705/g.38613 Transcript_13705/m.38613 type:complete len:271 (-) Transcript_13705:228-1040(-)
MGGGGHHVAIIKGAGEDAGSDEAADVSHVRHQVRSHRVRNLPHLRVVDVPGVRRRPRDDHLGAEQRRVPPELLVVDQAGGLVEVVGHGLKVHRGGADAHAGGRHVPVGEVAPVGQGETHHPVVRLEQRGVHREVRRRAAQRLHVHPPVLAIQPVRREGPLLAQALYLVDVLVPAVVPRAREALAVLVRQARPVHLLHPEAGEVLGSDELEPGPLPQPLPLDQVEELRVLLLDGGVVHRQGAVLDAVVPEPPPRGARHSLESRFASTRGPC